MSNTLDENLNIISENDSLEIELLNGDLNIIQKLDDEPNDVGGMTAAELKAEFDRAGLIIQKYINETLIPAILEDDATETARTAAENTRVSNENQRIANENTRAAAENQRIANETARVAAEQEREKASAEAGKKLDSLSQEAAEVERGLKNLEEFNCYDLLKRMNSPAGTSNGVTCTDNGDGSYTFSGTATADALFNFWLNDGDMPSFLKPNTKYRVMNDGSSVRLVFWCYDSTLAYIDGLSRYGNYELTTPSNMTRVIIRFKVDEGTTVDETIHPFLLDTYSNQELSDMIAQEAAKVKSDLKNLEEFNCYNLMDDLDKPSSVTHNGVTFTRLPDGSYRVEGTATEMALCNYYYDADALPEGIIPGETYHLRYSAANVELAIWFYKDGAYFSGIRHIKDADITVPVNASGLLIRLQVSGGVSVNETVRPVLLNAKSNQEIENLLAPLANALVYKGVLNNDADISTVDTGIYLLTGNTSAPTRYGTLFHFDTSSATKVQYIFRFTDLNIYYRRYSMEEWSDWQNTEYLYGQLYPKQNKQYLAFGDSLTWGALWNTAENGSAVITRASEGSRIPDRIANAIGCKNYINYGVGGMAITVAGTSTPKFIDYIKAQDISNASLITFMGGRNDGGADLGTSESNPGDGTICGGVKEIIEYIRSVNPTCQIVIIQTTPYTSVNAPWTARSGSGWTLNDVDYEFSQLCDDMNVGYCSWYGCSLFSRWSDLSGGGGNYSHMRTNESYEQMGNFIAGQVARYYSN